MDAAGWDERYMAAERLWSDGPNIFVESRLAHHEPGVGVDLASGEGRNAIWLADRGWQMTAVDFSRVAVERGRARSGDVDFIEADVFTWEPDRRFNLVLIAYLQVVAERLEPLVRRVAEWLVPEGELFMVGHDRSNIEHGVGGPQVPEILWDVDQLVGWLDAVEVVEAGVVERAVAGDGSGAHARDTLVRGVSRPRS
jgi:SAM-dependent methyltransferase